MNIMMSRVRIGLRSNSRPSWEPYVRWWLVLSRNWSEAARYASKTVEFKSQTRKFCVNGRNPIKYVGNGSCCSLHFLHKPCEGSKPSQGFLLRQFLKI